MKLQPRFENDGASGGGAHVYDTSLEVTLKSKDELLACIEDIPAQSELYAGYIDAIDTAIKENVWEGSDGAALKTKFEGYLGELKARQTELNKLSTLAKSLKEAIENAETDLTKNIGGE